MAINFVEMSNQALIYLNYQMSMDSVALRNKSPEAYRYEGYTGVDQMRPAQFAQAIYGPLFDSGYGVDSYYIACERDLNSGVRSYAPLYTFEQFMSQNNMTFKPVLQNSSGNISITPFVYTPPSVGTVQSGTVASTTTTTNVSDTTNQNISNDDSAKYTRKVALVDAYINKVKTTLSSDELTELNSKYTEAKANASADYDKANKKMDEFIATLNHDTLITVIQDKYKNDQNIRLNAAQNISDQWLTKINNGTSAASFKVNMSSVNVNNILDVLGTFIARDTSDTANWSTLIKNNYVDIKKVLVEKANQMKDSAEDDNLKTRITNAVTDLPEAVDDTNASTVSKKIYNLFTILRSHQATENDKNVYERYGLPESIEVTDAQKEAVKYATENYKKETNMKLVV